MFRSRISIKHLRYLRFYYTVDSHKVERLIKKDELGKQLVTKIKATGPITIAEYMKHVLTNPSGGYYMDSDVFGQEGDFITSPELGQLFGEMVAIWLVNEWSKAGSPKPLQIVELGPGRGTLCADILRVFQRFRLLDSTAVHLVEVSPLLSELQARRLCINSKTDINALKYKQGIGFHGVPISWYRSYKDVPEGFTLLIAHEFFDALPVHKIQKTEKGYREVLIDIDPTNETKLRYILARDETPVIKLFIKSDETRDHIEVSPESLALIKLIAGRLVTEGGIALIADYGYDGESKDSFRAFKRHQLHDPLVDPGTADLTADVDFYALKEVATEGGHILAYGPVTQHDFLIKMGIEFRMKKLEESCSEKQKEYLQSGFRMMTDEDKMGTRFKFLSLFPATLEKILNRFPPTGFI